MKYVLLKNSFSFSEEIQDIHSLNIYCYATCFIFLLMFSKHKFDLQNVNFNVCSHPKIVFSYSRKQKWRIMQGCINFYGR